MSIQQPTVVFIADSITNHLGATIVNADLERITDEYFKSVYNALNGIAKEVIVYPTITEFINNIARHKSDIVFSLWSGCKSHNRKALVPAICEAYNIKYIGADTYVQSLCIDKRLSKLYCKQFNVNSPKGVFINEYTKDFSFIATLNFPLIVKPNAEGGSIGISCENLAYSYDEALRLIFILREHHKELLVEEYIPGYEITVALWGAPKNAKIIGQCRYSLDDIIYFNKEINGFEAKKIAQKKWKKEAGVFLDETICKKLLQIYKYLGKVDFMRIDGRLNSNGYFLLELSPDASLAPNGSFSFICNEQGIPYREIFKILIERCLKND